MPALRPSRAGSSASLSKISPLEVDEVLMDHPDIAHVVTFARLGLA